MRMRKLMGLLVIAVLTAVTVLPDHADARAGGGRSSGSRGSRTYSSSPNTSPIQRSTTTNQTASPSSPTQQPVAPPAQGGFWRGIAGGFLGAGLASMLFGGGYGGGGFGLFPLILLGVIGYFIYSRVRGAGITPMYSAGGYYTPEPSIASQPLIVSDSDKAEFESLLSQVQHAWGAGDINHLRQHLTPEMLQYFNEELAANSSRGLANKVDQVQLMNAEVLESWHEYDMDYATVRMQWQALDYMVKLDRTPADADYVASGSNTLSQVAEEVWTFVRVSGGQWLLSAIQQTS